MGEELNRVPATKEGSSVGVSLSLDLPCATATPLETLAQGPLHLLLLSLLRHSCLPHREPLWPEPSHGSDTQQCTVDTIRTAAFHR